MFEAALMTWPGTGSKGLHSWFNQTVKELGESCSSHLACYLERQHAGMILDCRMCWDMGVPGHRPHVPHCKWSPWACCWPAACAAFCPHLQLWMTSLENAQCLWLPSRGSIYKNEAGERVQLGKLSLCSPTELKRSSRQNCSSFGPSVSGAASVKHSCI